MIFTSPHPDVEIPTDLTTWEWAFESAKYSQIHSSSKSDIGSYVNAATKERIDFFDVKEKAALLSTALVRRFGFQPGDTLSLFSTNTIWYPVALWAALRVGGRINGASPAYNAEEMSHALRTAQTRFLVTLPDSLEAALEACKKVGIPKQHIFLLEGSHADFRSIHDLMELAKADEIAPAYRIPADQTNKEVCGYLSFSSGTTGLPKAVMLSHHNVIAQCHQVAQLRTEIGERFKVLAIMPLFHITGLIRFCTYPVYLNGDCIMLPSFSMERMLDAVVEFEIRELSLVPPILIRMVRDNVVDSYVPDLNRLIRQFSSGAAPIAPEILRLLQKKFPDTGFRQGYGATESTSCISCHPPTHYDYKYAATGGILCANTVAKVVDIEDPSIILKPGQTGEICAKGPQICMGYLGNPTASAETFKDGWFHTGDVGHIDEEGLFHIEDRIKEMIKVKGTQVPPAELEDLLLGHELVDDCMVLGVADEYAGERPKAYVVLKSSVKPSKEVGQALLQYVKSHKVRYKWVAEIEFVDTVPKSPSGKLLRRVMKTMDRRKDREKGLCVRDETERARL